MFPAEVTIALAKGSPVNHSGPIFGVRGRMGNKSVAIVVTPRQRKLLKGFTRTKKAAQQLVERYRVVLVGRRSAQRGAG